MFSLFGKRNRDSFDERAKRQQVWNVLRGVINSRSPVERLDEDSDRNFKRYNRCVPIAVVDAGNINADEVIYAPTKDFSDNGLSFISASPVCFEDVVCVICLRNPVFLLGRIRRTRSFGGQLLEIGIEFSEVIESAACRASLQPVLDALETELEPIA